MTDRNIPAEVVAPMHEGTLREDGHHCDSGNCWCWEDRYMVITRSTISEVSEAVNAFMHQKRWIPTGGLSRKNGLWIQAMVRRL